MISRDLLKHIANLLRPLDLKIKNLFARGVVHAADDAGDLQVLQVGALAGETIDEAEHHQPYGFSSVPLEGAEMFVVFPNGDRGHPIVIASSDRRHRPTGGEPGEVTIYNNAGASVKLTKDGDILARAAPGREVLVDDGSGTTDALVKRSEFLAHGHATAGTGAPSPPTAVAANPDVGQFPGTTVLKAK